MSNVFLFEPKSILSAADNLNDLISHCQNNLSLYDDQGGWSCNNWKHIQGTRSIAMTFSKYRKVSNPSNFDLMDEPFLSFAKAYIRYTQTQKPVSSVTNKMVALRILHDALLEVHSIVDVLNIDGPTLSYLQELVVERVTNDDRRNKVGYQIQILLNFIREKGISISLQAWINPWPKVGAKAEKTDSESRKWQDERCPSLHQMLILADCFASASAREDIYWSSVLTLLMFAPSRAGELTELTVDCLHKGEGGALGVRWHAKKGYGHTIKWVPKDLEHVVIAAHAKLIEIGRPAREAAKYVFDSGNKFYRHKGCITPQGFPEEGMLSTLEFAHAMCFGEKTIGDIRNASKDENSDRAWNLVGAKSSQWVQRLLVHGKPTYKRLGEFVVDKYRTRYWPNFSENGQPVWNSLLLLRDQEFHGKFSPRASSWRLPSVNELNAQIASRDTLKTPPDTIFQRMGYSNEDGTPIRLTSHQIRVWLSTNAERGGMDSWKLAQWAGRARVDDNRHYDLRTTEERLSNARAVIGHQEKPSVLDAIKSNLPVSYKDLGINRLGVADVTKYGMCTHDYAMSPCIKAGECMTCKEHVCIKGMPNTAERIESLAIMVNSQLKKARLDETNEVFGADRWVTHLGWKLAHLRTQLDLMKSEKTPEGAVLRIPPEYDPSPIKRALEHRDLGTTANERDIVELSTIEQLLGIENA